MTVRVDKHILDATADALKEVSEDLPGLLTAADTLGVGHEVAQLRAAPTWAAETTIDLRARIGLLERMEDGDVDFGPFSVTERQLEEMAGASMPVDEQLYTLEAVATAQEEGEEILAWDGSQNFSQWITKIQARALEHLPLLDEQGELIEQGLTAFKEYQSLLAAGGMTTLAVSRLSQTQAYSLLFKVTSRYGQMGTDALRARGLLTQAHWLERGIQYVDDFYLAGRRTLTAPGTTMPWLKARAITYLLKTQDFDEILAAARTATNARGELALSARLLRNPLISRNAEQLAALARSPYVSRLANLTGTVFGRPWTTVVNGQQVVVARNATNLLTVARTDGLRTMARTGGAIRVLGVAGSAFATADSALGLYNSWQSGEMAQDWNEGGVTGKAEVVGDVAEVAFNASLTAAMVAPNPITWGAVAVTGLVYGGARLVEHWDDVTAALDTAKDWTADRLEDAGEWAGDRAEDIAEGVGNTIEAVKDSPINPGNWF